MGTAAVLVAAMVVISYGGRPHGAGGGGPAAKGRHAAPSRVAGSSDPACLAPRLARGEFLGDHGIPAKAPFLLDCMLHVPCLIRAPGFAAADCDALVESVDLFPTLSHLAGFDAPEWV